MAPLSRSFPLVALATLALALPAAAQTTHDVAVGPGFTFQPATLQIDAGDTVRWTWSGGFAHNVVSGVGGIPDGNFSSGAPTAAPMVFSLTFDAAFLAAHPTPNQAYDYFCSTHVTFGMVGRIEVDVPSSTSAYGCGTNPAGSLVEVSGAPIVGTTWTLGVDNPLGTQAPGALAFLVVASTPQPGFPCGVPLPGFGMVVPSGVGELLVGVTPPDPLLLLGPTTWSGTPAAFPLALPAQPALLGVSLFTQGLIFDPAPGPGPTFGLTTGIAAVIGNV